MSRSAQKKRNITKRRSLWIRLYETTKRNPIKFWTSIFLLLGAIPGGMFGLSYIDDKAEPWYIARHEWVRIQEEPILKTQEIHDYGINYLILKDQRQALKDAKGELAKHPDSMTAPVIIERLEKSIKRRQEKLDKEQK